MLDLSFAAYFHGHLGPWLVLGYKVGIYAKEKLKASSPFDLKCVAYLPKMKPYTCSLDGIQVASGCTLGKLNVELVDSDESSIKFVFTNLRSNESLELKLKPEALDLLKGFEGKDLERAAEEVNRMEIWELMEITYHWRECG